MTPINPMIQVITELVSTGVMGAVAVMWWLAYREERKRSAALSDGTVEMGVAQTKAIETMTHAIENNTQALRETQATLVTNSELSRNMSERMAIYFATTGKKE